MTRLTQNGGLGPPNGVRHDGFRRRLAWGYGNICIRDVWQACVGVGGAGFKKDRVDDWHTELSGDRAVGTASIGGDEGIDHMYRESRHVWHLSIPSAVHIYLHLRPFTRARHPVLQLRLTVPGSSWQWPRCARPSLHRLAVALDLSLYSASGSTIHTVTDQRLASPYDDAARYVLLRPLHIQP